MLVRAMKIRYRVATSDLAEDRAVAILLGVSPEDAQRIDTVWYSGARYRDSPELRYAFVKCYAGDVLIASKDIHLAEDPYNLKGRRLYQRARLMYEQELQTKKPKRTGRKERWQ